MNRGSTPLQIHKAYFTTYPCSLFITRISFYTFVKKTNMKNGRNYSTWKKAYYHLCSDGWKEGKIFYTPNHFAEGMTALALASLMFPVTIYCFTLMPNHFHIVLSGTGRGCTQLFRYLTRRARKRLIRDGYLPLPETYDFKLIPIENESQMRNNLIYVIRNPLEKNLTVPGGYPWGSGYLYYSLFPSRSYGERVGNLSIRTRRTLFETKHPIPDEWLYHEELGILPTNFVDTKLFLKLFPAPKDYEIRLVKDFEAYISIAEMLEETPSFSKEECYAILERLLQTKYNGRKLNELSSADKANLATILFSEYHWDTQTISRFIVLSEHLAQQIIYAYQKRTKSFGHDNAKYRGQK